MSDPKLALEVEHLWMKITDNLLSQQKHYQRISELMQEITEGGAKIFVAQGNEGPASMLFSPHENPAILRDAFDKYNINVTDGDIFSNGSIRESVFLDGYATHPAGHETSFTIVAEYHDTGDKPSGTSFASPEMMGIVAATEHNLGVTLSFDELKTILGASRYGTALQSLGQDVQDGMPPYCNFDTNFDASVDPIRATSDYFSALIRYNKETKIDKPTGRGPR